MNQKIIFAAGCFWGVEYKFDNLPGVVSTRVGYTGGLSVNPTYEQVCTDSTGHAEAVEVIFDPGIVSFAILLNHFFAIHDPTTPNRQGPDLGTQYRSAIFYTTDEQRKLAWEKIEEINKSGAYKHKVVTEIKPAGVFYSAEDYHQQYYTRQGRISCGF